MEKTFFNKQGYPVAYLTDDYDRTIYLWEGQQVAYLFDERIIYGTNGRQLGWFIDGVIYNHSGERIGFTSGTCPVAPSKEPVKPKKYVKDEIQARWKEDSLPKLKYTLASGDLSEFFKNGQVYNPRRARLNARKENGPDTVTKN